MKNLTLLISLLMITLFSCTKGGEPTPATSSTGGNSGNTVKTISLTLDISTIKGYPAKYLQASVNGGTLSNQLGITAAKVIATLKSDGSDTARVDVYNTTLNVKDFSFYVFVRNDSIKIHSYGLQSGVDFTYADGSDINYKIKYPNVSYDVTFGTRLYAGAYGISDMVTNSSIGTSENSIVLSY